MYKTKEERLKFYHSKEWKAVREAVLQRDNFECQECKRQGKVFTMNSSDKQKRLDVDHKKELETHPDLALDMDNLQVLCIRCHNKKHGRYQGFARKESKWDDEKW